MIKKSSVFVVLSLISSLFLAAFVPAVITAPTTVIAADATATPPAPKLETGPGGKIPLGIVLPDAASPIIAVSVNSFRSYLQKLGYSATILYSNGKTDTEKTNVQKLIDQGIKVLIICPVDSDNAANVANLAKMKGIKVISYERLITKSTGVNYYVSFSNTAVGESQAQYLVDHTEGSGVPLFLFAGSSNDNNAYMFFEGAWKVLQPKIADGTFVIYNSSRALSKKANLELSRSDMETIFDQISVPGWNPDEARKMAKEQLKNIPDDQKANIAILAPNDGTARAISDAVKADKAVKSFLITGQDADSASLSYIRSGRQSMTIYKDTRVLAKMAIDVAISILAGEPLRSSEIINNGVLDIPYFRSDITVVDKSNVDTFKK